MQAQNLANVERGRLSRLASWIFLMVIPYDQLLGVHSLTAILIEAAKYKADHGGAKFVRPPSTTRTMPMTP
jgi:hypothetical protein